MRSATIDRKTGETEIHLTLELDGRGKAKVNTGIGFLDHMLALFAHHGLFDLTIQAKGDLHVDATTRSKTWRSAWVRRSTGRWATRRDRPHGARYVPMDEALGFVAVDLSGRPYAVIDVTWHTGARRGW